MKVHEYERNYRLESDYWYFVGLRAIISTLLEVSVGQAKLGRVLDVGCGTGALLDELEPRCAELWGVDISPEALEFCRERGHKNLILTSATTLPFDDGYFDLVTAIGLIEHIEDDEAFINETRRVLKRGGTAILMTSSFPFLWSMHDVANEHIRRYYLRDFNRKMSDAGFTVIRSSHVNFVLFPALAVMLMGHRLLYGLKAAQPERILPVPPKPINAALTAILRFEARLIRRLCLPWGVSMVGAYRLLGAKP
jgi:SAM-dependent methyltransferase